MAAEGTHKQQAKNKYWFTFIQKDGNSKNATFYEMTCEYFPNEKKYVLELFYQYRNNTWNNVFLCSAGTFTCSEDGTEWVRQKQGTFDSLFGIETYETDGNEIVTGGNVNISNLAINSTTVENGYAYIPVPMEDGFSNSLGFTRKMDTTQIVYDKWCQINKNWKEYREWHCSYNAANDTYTLEIYYKNNSGNAVFAGRFTCQSYSIGWTQIQ